MSDPILKRILNLVYPVGSIYISSNSTSPAVLFGGSWTQIKDTFLIACGNVYGNGVSGGSANHTHTTQAHALTTAELPAHRHTFLSIPNTDTQTWKAPNQVFEYKYVEGTHYMKYTDETGSNAAHSHGNTGSSSNMPPYLGVYVWKRIG